MSSRVKQRSALDWTRRASCQGLDPDRFDVPPEIGLAIRRREWGELLRFLVAAAAPCARCPVARECARDALECGDVSVIRGGIAIPPQAQYSTRDRYATRRVLTLVAAGASPPMVWRSIGECYSRPVRVS